MDADTFLSSREVERRSRSVEDQETGSTSIAAGISDPDSLRSAMFAITSPVIPANYSNNCYGSPVTWCGISCVGRQTDRARDGEREGRRGKEGEGRSETVRWQTDRVNSSGSRL